MATSRRNRAIAFACLVIATFVLGQDETGDLSELSLEQLLNMTIVTASKQEESMSESPAIVSVITARDLENKGVRSLAEALSYLPGVELTESYFGYTTVNFRGVRQSHYNNKVLLMINGHPSFEKVNGSFHLEQVPIAAIERIEVVRGPGSALYGTNAFTGVINIITKRQGEATLVELEGGSYDKVEGRFFHRAETKLGDWSIGGTWSEDNGYPYTGVLDEPSGGGRELVDLDYFNDTTNLFVEWRNKGFTFNASWFKQEKNKWGLTPENNWTGKNLFEGFYLDLLYEKELSLGELQFRLRYDEVSKDFDIGHFPADAALGRDTDTLTKSQSGILGGEIQYSVPLGEKASFITGIVYEDSSTDPYPFIFKSDGAISPFSAYLETYDTQDLSVYAQCFYKPNDRATLIAGARFNDNSDAEDTETVPRLGVVFKMAEEAYVKLLYGEAYRNPDFFEKYAATNGVLWGDPGLHRELIATIDLGFDFHIKDHYALRINAFQLEIDNLIARRAAIVNPNGAEYYNSEGEKVDGVEMEFKAIHARHEAFLAASYKNGENKLDNSDLAGIAGFTANAAWHYKWDRLKFAASAQYIGKRDFVSQLDGSGSIDAYTLANLGVFYDVNSWTFSAWVKNLTDESYTYPEYIRANVARAPGGPDRTFFASVKYQFKL